MAQCEAAGRALSAIISKMIKNGGFPYWVYTTLVDSCVNSIVDYTSAVTGFNHDEEALKIQLRAARAYLGIPRNGTKCAILSEIDWLLPCNRSKIEMIRFYNRLLKMDDNKLTKKVFNWDKDLNDRKVVDSWYNEVKTILSECSYQHIYEIGSVFPLKSTLKSIKQSLKIRQNECLKLECGNMPKLRIFNLFKNFEQTASYITKPLSFVQRRALANLRVGTFKIRAETQRYVRPKIPYDSRVCVACDNTNNEVENEEHYIFNCNLYSGLRSCLYKQINKPENFNDLNLGCKLKVLLENGDNVKHTANFILNSFDIRSKKIF